MTSSIRYWRAHYSNGETLAFKAVDLHAAARHAREFNRDHVVTRVDPLGPEVPDDLGQFRRPAL